MGNLESNKKHVLSEFAVEGHGGDCEENCRTVTELDNSVPREQEGDLDDIHNRFKVACVDAREIAIKTSKWNGELLKFLAENATNWDMKVIPTDFQAWITQEKDMEAAQKTGKWIDLKMVM
jgi:hypothetical protein